MSDEERRAAEHEALQAIYADQLEDSEPSGPWRITLGVAGASLECFLPADYPSSSPPTPLLHSLMLQEETCNELVSELVPLYDGAEVVYTWVEHLRERLTGILQDELVAAESAAAMGSDTAVGDALADTSAVRATESVSEYTFTPATSRYGQRVRHFGSASNDPAFRVDITSGPSFHPPKSGPSEEFQAHVATVTCMGHVEWVLAALLSDKRIARASHNMHAYRFVDKRGVQVADNEDDGESSSGAKLASLLELTRVNNVLVVVSRWFGGIHLGPARFKYIASTARLLLEETGHCTRGSAPIQGSATGRAADAANNHASGPHGRGKSRS